MPLIRYVNRNLLAVGVEQPGDGNLEEPSLMILLVDTVSGRVVRHTSAYLCLRLLTSAYLCLPLLTSACA